MSTLNHMVKQVQHFVWENENKKIRSLSCGTGSYLVLSIEEVKAAVLQFGTVVYGICKAGVFFDFYEVYIWISVITAGHLTIWELQEVLFAAAISGAQLFINCQPQGDRTWCIFPHCDVFGLYSLWFMWQQNLREWEREREKKKSGGYTCGSAVWSCRGAGSWCINIVRDCPCVSFKGLLP